jgi:general secretion pathway protein A
MLRYGIIGRAQITVITGEVGSGKTTLLRKLLSEITNDIHVGLVSNMQTSKGQLLNWVMLAFDQEIVPGEDYVLTFKRFQDFLIDKYSDGKRCIIIFDEAQNLEICDLEELRLLSNINSEKNELLQIIIVGQPELRDKLRKPELRQFLQRVSADFSMSAMNNTDVKNYIQHRLNISGASWRIFTDEACNIVYHVTKGVPRLVNIFSDFCLVSAFSIEKKVIDADFVLETLKGMADRNIYDQFDFSILTNVNFFRVNDAR